jgi:hypothetical protein
MGTNAKTGVMFSWMDRLVYENMNWIKQQNKPLIPESMKKLMFVLVSVCMTLIASAQKDPVGSIFDQYSGKEGFTTVNITGDMLNMFTRMEEERKDTVIQSKLTNVRILAREGDENKGPVLDLKAEVYDKLDKNAYKEMMSVKESDQDVLILVKEDGGRISEFLLIVSGKDEAVLIQAKGDILMREMADLAGKYQMKGFEQLKHLEKN